MFVSLPKKKKSLCIFAWNTSPAMDTTEKKAVDLKNLKENKNICFEFVC